MIPQCPLSFIKVRPLKYRVGSGSRFPLFSSMYLRIFTHRVSPTQSSLCIQTTRAGPPFQLPPTTCMLRSRYIAVMKQIALNVNGRQHNVNVDPDTPLLFVLTDDLGLRGPRFGCGVAQCGSCTVIIRGQVVRSCVMPVSAAGPDEITTLEGIGTPEKPHALQQAFIDEGAAQCGFCLSGVILTAKAVLDAKPTATDEEIRIALGGVLCRCFTHTRMLSAVRKYRQHAIPA
jgi:nicotinate dehydrogenase subunit A